MEKITSLVRKLKNSAASEPQLHSLTLQKGELFSWNHSACAITYNPHNKNAESYLLHEFSHALLGHKEYSKDIELLKMERAAWDKALALAGTFNVKIDNQLIESSLDTYRDWLHDRSICPACAATGIEINKQHYECIACHTTWRVNEARSCELRRYVAKKHLT